MRDCLASHGGHEVDTAGDGFFVTFERSAPAFGCATAVVRHVRDLGLSVRAGVHTGECDLVGEKPSGIAVVIGARVAALAGPGQVLATRTVKDLVAGSGIVFEDAGSYELKGVPGRWELCRLPDDDAGASPA